MLQLIEKEHYIFEFQEKCLPWKEFQHNVSKTDMEKAIKLKKKFITFNADINLPYVFIAELIKVYGENEVKNLFTEAAFYNPDLLKDIITEAVHLYAKEPYHNIIINDLDDVGLELLEYRGTDPMFLLVNQ